MNSNRFDMTFEETAPTPLTDEEFIEFQKAEQRKESMFGVISSALLDIIDFFI